MEMPGITRAEIPRNCQVPESALGNVDLFFSPTSFLSKPDTPVPGSPPSEASWVLTFCSCLSTDKQDPTLCSSNARVLTIQQESKPYICGRVGLKVPPEEIMGARF